MAIQLYDFRNRPINMAELRSEPKRRFGIGRSNGWERITDGTQVDPTWIATTIKQMEAGNVAAGTRLAARMIERFPSYGGAIAEISDALGEKYRVMPASQSRDDRKIADSVKRVVESDEFVLGLMCVRDAISVGWGTVEMQWGVDSTGRFVPQRFIRVPPDAIKYADDGVTPQIVTSGYKYEPLEWGRFIAHVSQVRSGLPVNLGMFKSCAYLYLFYTMAYASWSGHLERAGSPYLIGKHRKGADDNEVEALREAIEDLHAEASVVMDETMMVETLQNPSVSNGNGVAFRDFGRAIDNQVRIAVLKVDMSDTSSGSRALGEVLQKSKQARFRTFAFQESATMRRDLVRAIMAVNFEGGAIRPAPYLHLDIEDAVDMKELATGLGPLIDRGAQVRVAEVLDRCGMPIPEGMDPKMLMYPLNSNAAIQNAPEVQAAEAKAAAAHLATLKADERAEGYARAILRIVDVCDEPEIRKRDLVPRIKAVAREFGLDVKAEEAT